MEQEDGDNVSDDSDNDVISHGMMSVMTMMMSVMMPVMMVLQNTDSHYLLFF